MSLAINTDDVEGVLLADGWHDVTNRSFDIDAYEYTWNGRVVLGGGVCEGVPSTGYEFTSTDGKKYCGPLTAILSVRRKKN